MKVLFLVDGKEKRELAYDEEDKLELYRKQLQLDYPTLNLHLEIEEPSLENSNPLTAYDLGLKEFGDKLYTRRDYENARQMRRNQISNLECTEQNILDLIETSNFGQEDLSILETSAKIVRAKKDELKLMDLVITPSSIAYIDKSNSSRISAF